MKCNVEGCKGIIVKVGSFWKCGTCLKRFDFKDVPEIKEYPTEEDINKIKKWQIENEDKRQGNKKNSRRI